MVRVRLGTEQAGVSDGAAVCGAPGTHPGEQGAVPAGVCAQGRRVVRTSEAGRNGGWCSGVSDLSP